MNDTLKIIAERFSCRNFTDKQPDDAALQSIAQAAIQSPSGMNSQNWQVIVVKNRDILAAMEKEGMDILSSASDKSGYDRIMSRGGKLFYNTPCMVIVAVKGSAGIDCGILAQNVVLAAESLGINTLHCGMAGMIFSGPRGAEFKEMLQFPAGYECGIGVLLGYAVEKAQPHVPNQDKITVIA